MDVAIKGRRLERFGMSLYLVFGRRTGRIGFGIFCGVFALSSAMAQASIAPRTSERSCEGRVETREAGRFSVDPIDEASGLALSPDGQHFFVTNDSGDSPRFFRTRLDGSTIEEFSFKGYKPIDAEDISVGPCPSGITGSCVALADIGDNRDRRKNVTLGFFRIDELPKPPTGPGRGRLAAVEIPLAKKIKFVYPEGPRNAEAFGVLNSRYGVIVSKRQEKKSRATLPADVYVVDFEKERTAKVAEWDVPTWVKDQGLGALVTGLSIAPMAAGSGSVRMLLLTYRDVIEVTATTDILTSNTWPPKPWILTSRSVLKVDPLEQQEAITYDAKGTGFFYATEAPLALLGYKTAPIRYVEKIVCQ